MMTNLFIKSKQNPVCLVCCYVTIPFFLEFKKADYLKYP